MLRRTLSVIALAAAALPVLPTAAIDPARDRGDHPLAWLAGRWVGEGLGGEVEEVWSPPRAGVMVGMFQHVVAGHANFYELFTVGKDKGEWVMRLRHFDAADLRAWEARDGALAWEPSALEEGRAGFGPVFYELEGANRLRVSVELESGGETATEEFVLTRVE